MKEGEGEKWEKKATHSHTSRNTRYWKASRVATCPTRPPLTLSRMLVGAANKTQKKNKQKQNDYKEGTRRRGRGRGSGRRRLE